MLLGLGFIKGLVDSPLLNTILVAIFVWPSQATLKFVNKLINSLRCVSSKEICGALFVCFK